MAQAETDDGKLSVFVDLDETLVYQCAFEQHPMKEELEEKGIDHYKLSRLTANQINEILPDGCKVFHGAGRLVAVRRRPYAKEFLGKLREMVGKLCCLTMGRTIHQRRVLEAAGLSQEFEVLVGREKYGALIPQKGRNWLLLDDLDPKDPTCTAKLNGLGVLSSRALRVMDMQTEEEIAGIRNRVIIVPAYNGKGDDDGLVRIWPEVEGKIRTFGRLMN